MMTRMLHDRMTKMICGMTMLLTMVAAHAELIAQVESAEGVIVVEHEGQPSHVIGRGSALEKGDTVVTQSGSHAQLLFKDQTRVAVRPNSRLQLNDFVFKESAPRQDSFVMTLLKGGLRQVTGLISRSKPSYRLQAQNATIGIRGTDFTARICDGLECTMEQSATDLSRNKSAPASGTVGKIVWIKGTVSAKSTDGVLRTLAMASPVFQGDILISAADGSAGLALLDNTRLVVPEDSQVSLTQYQFVAARAEESRILIDLLKGGLRAVTGLLGKLHNDRIKFRAASATIGIRGTAFDMVCTGVCAGGSLYVTMRSGEISLSKDKNSIVVGAGQYAAILQNGLPKLLPAPPPVQLKPALPKPEDIKVNAGKLFGMESKGVPNGLYVAVNSGNVSLVNAGGELLLARGEAGFTGAAQVPVQLPSVPGFMDRDPILSNYNPPSLSCNQ